MLDPDAILGKIPLALDSLPSDISLLNLVGIGLVCLFITKTLFAILINKKILWFCRDVQISLRERMMIAYQSMEYVKLIEKDSSDAINNTTILTMQYTNAVLYSTLKALAELVLCCFLLVFLIRVNGMLVLVLALGLSFLVIGYGSFFRTRMIFYGQQVNLANSKAMQAVSQALQGIKEIRVLGKERFFRKTLVENAKIYASLHAQSVLVGLGGRYFIELLLMVFFVASIAASSFFMEGGSAEIFPTLAMFGFAAVRLIPSANAINAAILVLRSHKDTVERLSNALDELSFQKQSLVSDQDCSEASTVSEFMSLKMSKISFSYPRATKEALKNIDFEIHSGESIGIIGPSGSGKTTLVDLFLGLLMPDKGSMLLNDVPLEEVKTDWGKMLAYIPQESLIINDSLRNNIILPCEKETTGEQEIIFRSSLSRAKLNRVVDDLDGNEEANLGERGVRLSGGQRQRVAIARALFHSRKIFVFDEATSALDLKTEEQIVQQMKQMKGVKTMLTIAHRLDTLRYCDRIYRLSDGAVVEVGRPQDIIPLHATK